MTSQNDERACIDCPGHGGARADCCELVPPPLPYSRDAALAAMGEAEDSLMLGGCGGGERDPDLEWY